MKILISRPEFPDTHLVLVFGLGLIGSAISHSLSRLGFQQLTNVSFDWQDSGQMANAQDAIEATCLGCAASKPVHLSIVWSAGNTGFFSTQNEVDKEYLVFKRTLDFAARLRENLQPNSFKLHFISSAGGLFEGQRVIQETSRPSPIRPYGRLKMHQEELISDALNSDEFTIYRPSSVYGPTAQKNRHGLINNLVSNAHNNRITVLDAHLMSLRDYVLAGDIGSYVGRQIRFKLGNQSNQPVQFLVSARSSSIFEVVEKIKRILNLHAPFRYDDQFGNHENITFSDRVKPCGWRPMTLDMGIRQFMTGRQSIEPNGKPV